MEQRNAIKDIVRNSDLLVNPISFNDDIVDFGIAPLVPIIMGRTSKDVVPVSSLRCSSREVYLLILRKCPCSSRSTFSWQMATSATWTLSLSHMTRSGWWIALSMSVIRDSLVTLRVLADTDSIRSLISLWRLIRRPLEETHWPNICPNDWFYNAGTLYQFV